VLPRELRSSPGDEALSRASDAPFPVQDVRLSTSSGFDDPSDASTDIGRAPRVMLAPDIVHWRDGLSRDERETYINIELP